MAFADLLRGLAAFAVVLGHFTMLFLKGPDVVARITMAEPIPAATFPAVIDEALSLFSPAAIGVAVFFLISGFVIPLSLDGASVRAYLLKRLLRIFPTYWVALAIGLLAIFLSGAFWSKPLTHTRTDYIANAFLIADFFGRFDILSVMWTLQIELKFYLLAPLFHFSLKKGSLRALYFWGAGVVAVYWLSIAGCAGGVDACWSHRSFVFALIAREALYITYMLIGSVFYARYRGLVTTRQTVLGVAGLLSCFEISLLIAPFSATNAPYHLAGLWGVAIFGSCYLLRERISLTRPFRFLANISYPLYLVHPLVGYVVMRLLMAGGVPYLLAVTAALALVISLAAALHLYVEARSIAYGKRLADLTEPATDQSRKPPESAAALEARAFAGQSREPALVDVFARWRETRSKL